MHLAFIHFIHIFHIYSNYINFSVILLTNYTQVFSKCFITWHIIFFMFIVVRNVSNMKDLSKKKARFHKDEVD